jgi:DNA-directed RNA polymerase subunit RPC12/RpoP
MSSLFPWENILEHNNNSIRCTHCRSDQVELIRVVKYCNHDDTNPHEYQCNSCGKTFEINN